MFVGAGVQVFFERDDARQHPAPGDFVTLADGRQFHYQLTGAAHDGPLVILEAGGGSLSPQWARVQEEVAEFTQVLSYDRAGMGWSEGVTKVGLQPDAPTTDLYDLLAALDMSGPYVFVGHSYGAVFVRMHAHATPEEVLGVVLVDPAHEEQFQRIPAMENQTQLTVIPHLARIGGRFVRDVVSPWFITQNTDLKDVPVRVFHAVDAEWPDAEVRNMQEELLDLSTDSVWAELPGDHFSILTRPHSTQEIAEAIRQLANVPAIQLSVHLDQREP